jgi:iron complex transport system permease protein
MGAVILLSADTLARAFMWPEEVPVGIMTSLIGGPFFLIQLLRRGKDWWT